MFIDRIVNNIRLKQNLTCVTNKKKICNPTIIFSNFTLIKIYKKSLKNFFFKKKHI